MLKIFPVETDEHLEIAKQLFVEYADYLKEVFSEYLALAQRISQETLDEADSLPGEYVLPKGCVLLAEYQGEIAGCIAVSEMAEGVCELKRIYVKPEFRRLGIGKKLLGDIIEKAIELDYKRMRLHTTGLFAGAKELYKSFGFKDDGHIEGSPIKSSVHMKLDLG
jgi:ribosomal protein S18 acetylase RimI-like enzyme